jgi:hypothetical protein
MKRTRQGKEVGDVGTEVLCIVKGVSWNKEGWA